MNEMAFSDTNNKGAKSKSNPADGLSTVSASTERESKATAGDRRVVLLKWVTGGGPTVTGSILRLFLERNTLNLRNSMPTTRKMYDAQADIQSAPPPPSPESSPVRARHQANN